MKKFKTSQAVVLLFMIGIMAMSFVSHQNPADEPVVVEEQDNYPVSTALATPPSSKSVFEVADSICQEAGVPFELIKEIGNNESGWRYISNTNGGTDHGDLQVIEETYWYWYHRLDLTGGKNRRNYLKVGIYYLRYQYDRYGSWRKARFAYGRGSWRPESSWTALEKKFMSKIDWSKYDASPI